jgi:hypothetical protein
VKFVKGFFAFWYDFILALGYVLVESGLDRLAEVLLPLAAIGTIAASLPQLRSR